MVNRWRALLAWLSLACLVAFSQGSVSARPRDGAAEHKPKVRLRLVAEPQVGFTPVSTMLTGTLIGISPTDANFCHAATTWVRISPGQLEENASRYHQDSACRHPENESEATTTFTKVFDLYRPGAYLFKLIVEGKDQRTVESTYVKVEVLRTQ